jgi:hypothetical protein
MGTAFGAATREIGRELRLMSMMGWLPTSLRGYQTC